MTNEVPSAGAVAADSGDQPNNPAHMDNHDDNNSDMDALPHDEEASYCSTTSEESLAHSDADEDDEAGEEGDTIASPSRTSSARRTVRTPSFSYDDLARRPRSNPRTRTPLRNPSPLLQGLRREQHVAAATAETTNAERNVSGMHSPQIRAAPQDAGTSVTNGIGTGNSTVSSPQAQPQPQQQRVTIRLNAGLPVGSLPSSSTTARASATFQTATRRNAHQTTAQRSTKQGPSRRKVRRWTNDSMRSVAADLARSNTRGSLAAADVYARGVTDGELRRQYEMPNAPRNYRSSFDVLTRLVDRWELDDDDDDDEEDKGCEEKKEENYDSAGGVGDIGVVGNDNSNDPAAAAAAAAAGADAYASTSSRKSRRKHQKETEQRKKMKKKRAELLAARDRFLRGETASPANNDNHHHPNSSRFTSGRAMFQHLDPRMRSIVLRAVSSASSSTSTSKSSPVSATATATYAAKLLNAMEDLLVHRKMVSEESRKLVEGILARPLVMGGDADADADADADVIGIKDDNKSNKKEKKMKKRSKNKHKNKVGYMTYRFHFEAATTNNATAGNSSGGRNAGFYRLLLHAVCQFHGMNASSSTCSYHYNSNIGDGKENTTIERVLTVTGTCRGREHRIVDEACRYMAEES